MEMLTNYSLDYNRINNIAIVKSNRYDSRFLETPESIRYSVNFYDFILNKVYYNNEGEKLSKYFKAKIFLEDLNKSTTEYTENEILSAFQSFQKDLAIMCLKLAGTKIKDIVPTLPLKFDAPKVTLENIKLSKDRICILDDSILEHDIDLNILATELFIDNPEMISGVDIGYADTLVFKKGYWLLWAHKKGYNIIFDYSSLLN